ncbi:hypothetical protein CDAR_500871 [Caerostris darwini]|uniref:Uncharacterized protein n=1 Tax=Caerostris darwini TaxID=1538125 RepID=A0AAV4NL04_9ARAC|nr:hypothetical protein CDAR_500871 [Caerostris darwini]
MSRVPSLGVGIGDVLYFGRYTQSNETAVKIEKKEEKKKECSRGRCGRKKNIPPPPKVVEQPISVKNEGWIELLPPESTTGGTVGGGGRGRDVDEGRSRRLIENKVWNSASKNFLVRFSRFD